MRQLISVDTAAQALGLDPQATLPGYVFKGEMIAANPDLVRAFAMAWRRAKELPATDDIAWDRLRDRMNTGTHAEFEALQAGFRAGIPAPGPWRVAALVLQEIVSGEIQRHLLETSQRVILAFLLAMPIGTLIGLVIWRTHQPDARPTEPTTRRLRTVHAHAG